MPELFVPLGPLQKPSEEPYVEIDVNSLEKEDDKSKFEGKVRSPSYYGWLFLT